MPENVQPIRVSIICNAYNHSKYIREALDGFMMQKTSFRFEVLVHDDASTDGTADIIREYEAKYPEVIKPIYQTENQYSKGVKISAQYQYPRVSGEYVAFCEGDDYWTDPMKLQKQVDLLDMHPDVDICSHAHFQIDAQTGGVIFHCIRRNKTDIIPTEEIILGGGGYVATASLLYRSALLKKIPPFRQMIGIDYTIQVHGALRGGMLYIPDEMSAKRVNVPASWTTRMAGDKKRKRAHKDRMYKMLCQMDRDTEGRYHKAIAKVKARTRLEKYLLPLRGMLRRK